MKKMMKIAAMFLVVITTTNAIAQELPQPSPKAKVEQRIGLTDVTVEYSRPSVKDRKIFGELVPYDKIWRTGANMNTLITFTDMVKINGERLKPGTYSLFMIPSKSRSWTLLFNTIIDGWGEGKYEQNNNVLKTLIEPKAVAMQESMLFSFDNLTENSGNLILSWEKVAVEFKIEVEVEEKAWKNIYDAIEGAEEGERAAIYRNSAKYAASTKQNLKEGLEWISASIKIKPYWYSYWVKGDLLIPSIKVCL